MKYEPKKGEPFQLSTFLSETVRMADHATRDVHAMVLNKKGSPKALREIVDRYRHIASRLDFAADSLNAIGKPATETVTTDDHSPPWKEDDDEAK